MIVNISNAACTRIVRDRVASSSLRIVKRVAMHQLSSIDIRWIQTIAVHPNTWEDACTSRAPQVWFLDNVQGLDDYEITRPRLPWRRMKINYDERICMDVIESYECYKRQGVSLCLDYCDERLIVEDVRIAYGDYVARFDETTNPLLVSYEGNTAWTMTPCATEISNVEGVKKYRRVWLRVSASGKTEFNVDPAALHRTLVWRDGERADYVMRESVKFNSRMLAK